MDPLADQIQWLKVTLGRAKANSEPQSADLEPQREPPQTRRCLVSRNHWIGLVHDSNIKLWLESITIHLVKRVDHESVHLSR